MTEHIKITTKIKMNTKTTVKLFWHWPENNQLKSHEPGVFVGPIIFIMQIPPKPFQNFRHNTNGITGLSQLKPDIRIILFDTAYFQW